MDVSTYAEVMRNRVLLLQILQNQASIAHMLIHLQPEHKDPTKVAEMALEVVRGVKKVLEP